jgi:hypothetical protein
VLATTGYAFFYTTGQEFRLEEDDYILNKWGNN